MSYADADDVATSLMRELTPVEAQYVGALLERVEAQILTRIPKLDEKFAAGDPFATVLVQVEADAVARVFRNPSGMSQESDGSYSYSVNMLVSSGLLDILSGEWERLGVTSPISSSLLVTDEYARNRYSQGLTPAQWFEYGWPSDGWYS